MSDSQQGTDPPSGAQGLITQVSKDGSGSTPKEKKKKRGFFSRYCCCCFYTSTREVEETYKVPINTTVAEPYTESLLPIALPEEVHKKTLVLDLDETLVHSSFKPVPNPDFVIPVEIEDQIHRVYVLKRPGVDHFLKQMGNLYEIVVFTASLSKYADPVLDLLDRYKVVKHRLFREACTNHQGNYVKDLSRLGRKLQNSIIIDNSESSYLFHRQNAIPIETWFDDENDTELLDLIPLLEHITTVDDVRPILQKSYGLV